MDGFIDIDKYSYKIMVLMLVGITQNILRTHEEKFVTALDLIK